MSVVPFVSVVLPAYNIERDVVVAVESILRQFFSDFELIVIDDGSTDRTVDLIKGIGDARIRLLRNGTNRGIVFSLNRGLDEARGRYIARMDADDIARPERLARQVAFLEAHPDVGVCGSWVRKFVPHGPRWIYRGPTASSELKTALLFATPFVHPSVMIRHSVLAEHAFRYRDGYDTAEDYRLWCDLALVTELATIPDVLLDYRVSLSSVTGAVFFDRERLARRRTVLRQIWGEFMEKTMGVTPNVTQLDAHTCFYDRKFVSISSKDKKAAIEWLGQLQQANRKRGFFDGTTLAAVCDVAARSIGDFSPADIVRRTLIMLFGR